MVMISFFHIRGENVTYSEIISYSTNVGTTRTNFVVTRWRNWCRTALDKIRVIFWRSFITRWRNWNYRKWEIYNTRKVIHAYFVILHVQQTPKPEAHDPELVPPLVEHSSLKNRIIFHEKFQCPIFIYCKSFDTTVGSIFTIKFWGASLIL